MKISLNWIKDYVDLEGIETDQIINRFTLSTAEIEGYEIKGANTYGIVFAKILEVNEHPLSTKLHILKVDKGDEIVQIVCGAPNVRVGMVTCLATVGGCVCGNKIKTAKLAGVESFGMCCGEDELGVGSDTTGIIDVKEEVVIGQDVKKHWPIDDVIIEIDNKSLTNRPDLWGHYGIAREIAAIFSRPLKPLDLQAVPYDEKLEHIDIDVKTPACQRYSAISVKNITKKITPQVLKIRLNYVEQRDINLLADLTNYVMFDIGQPMHAFDNKKVKGIVVDLSKEREKLLTLENITHDIPQNTITIYNQNRQAAALAGIKGGFYSSISDDTNSLLLESATFDATYIRKASIALGLRTQSSLRYEKTLDPELTVIALQRFLWLLHKIDSGVVVSSNICDVYLKHYDDIELKIDSDFLSKRIGIEIQPLKAQNILSSLGFDVKLSGQSMIVKVPTFRATKDISIKEDIVEEVARMIGYDNIAPQHIYGEIKPATQEVGVVHEYEIKKLLAHKYSLNEIHSYIWNYEDFNKQYNIKSESIVRLLDSSNSGQSGIRSELLPTLIKVFDENKNSHTSVSVFEIGQVAKAINENGLVDERKKLAILLADSASNERDLYFKLKEILLDITHNVIKAKLNIDVCKHQSDLFHDKNSCSVVDEVGNVIGEFGIINPRIKYDKKFKIAMLEMDFEQLCNLNHYATKIEEGSKYQEVSLDFNFLANKSVMFGQIENALDAFRCNFIAKYRLKDVYCGGDDQQVSYTIGYKIASKDHTLTSKEIDNFSFRLINHMKQKGFELKQ